jgi:hypothetical protein
METIVIILLFFATVRGLGKSVFWFLYIIAARLRRLYKKCDADAESP